MSSPYRASDRSSSSQRSTPSRTLSNGAYRTNGFRQSTRDVTRDSPSRQLVEDFNRMLVNEERAFRSSLNAQDAAQHKLHLAALDRALARHEEVRESAERARERVELEIERDRRRRIDEEKRAAEQARRELEEEQREREQRQQREEQEREEERRRREARQREADEAKRNAETRQRQEEEEKLKREREQKDEADRKARQESETRERAQQSQKERQLAAEHSARSAPQTNGTGAAGPTLIAPPTTNEPTTQLPDLPQGLVSSMHERETVHKQYLQLHQRLKIMRKQVLESAKQVPGLKNQLSEWRRTIQKCCGQLSKASTDEAKATNKRAMMQIIQQLDAAAAVANPPLDITHYLVQNQQPPNANPQGPACLLFLLNHFSKNILGQFISESSVDSKTADSIGVLAVTIFARPQYLFNGQSLIDILWAKFHKHCPVLFGIYGNEKTARGRERIGWHKEGEEGSKSWATEQQHQDRMAGLGAGFVAITLRDFSKSKNNNPAPNRIYWEAFARIINTPAQEVQPTHFFVLRAIITNYVPRILSTFGGAGIAALRQALIYFPAEKGPVDEKGKNVPIVTAVQNMPAMLEKEMNLTL